jgi:hypothetical protein
VFGFGLSVPQKRQVMNAFRPITLAALVLFSLFASSCIYVEDNGPDVILQSADLEVRVNTPSGFVVQGAEITLYQTYNDALHYRFPIAKGWTDGYGVVIFNELPAGYPYYVRAQGAHAFSLGSVLIEHAGLWVIQMELI